MRMIIVYHSFVYSGLIMWGKALIDGSSVFHGVLGIGEYVRGQIDTFILISFCSLVLGLFHASPLCGLLLFPHCLAAAEHLVCLLVTKAFSAGLLLGKAGGLHLF